MADEIFLEGKSFVSAKRASELSGYARDYIGQLARGGLIGAQRVGGLWYVSLDSLTAYQKNADSFTPVQPQKTAQDLDAVVSFDGKDYISASKAAKLTSYNQDYIGQLARAGKILSRQIGNRWYVERAGLLAHKAQKDAMLGAVQAESVGLTKIEKPVEAPVTSYTPLYAQQPLLRYIPETDDLMPKLDKHIEPEVPSRSHGISNPVPIHVVKTSRPTLSPIQPNKIARKSARPQRNIIRAAKIGAVLTFVIVLSYGLVTLKDSSVYTTNVNKHTLPQDRSALTANASNALNFVLSALEKVISPEIDYVRKP